MFLLFSPAGNPSVLQCLKLPILSKEQCVRAYGSQITENMFCAGLHLSRFMDLCAHSVSVYVVDPLVVLVSVA